MEYFLSVIIIILLIFQNVKYGKERKDLKETIDGLNEKLNGLHYLIKTLIFFIFIIIILFFFLFTLNAKKSHYYHTLIS